MIIYVWIIDIYETTHPRIYWSIFLLLFLSVQVFQAMGHCLSLLSNNNSFIYIALANCLYTLMILTANFFTKIANLHYSLQIISNLSICRFMIEGNLILQYGFGRCRPNDIQSILYNMNIPGDHYYYHCIRMLIFQLLLFRLISFAILIAKSNPLQNRRLRAERIEKYRGNMKPSNAIIPGLSSHVEFRIRKIYN